MRRKSGQLVPLETAICDAALRLRARGDDEFHGYELAKALRRDADARLLTAYGTLYRALGRLEAMGLLTSRWEDPAAPAVRDCRPPRRLYALTQAGEAAAEQARRDATASARKRRSGLAPA